MELNETELSVLAKFHEMLAPAFDSGDEYQVIGRTENPTGFMTDLRARKGRAPGDQKIFEDLPSAITAGNITVGFLVYHDGTIVTAIEGYIADENENWEEKGGGIEWLSDV